MTGGMTSMTIANVTVRLGGRAVLDGVDLSVHAGQVLALVGPNGAGKTTLLSVMAGDLAPDSGTVLLDGEAVARIRVGELARRRAVLPQEQRLAFGFRAVDVVRMGRAPWAGRPEEDDDDAVVADAMMRGDVLGLAERKYPTMSGGEKARTSFARILAQSTALVLLDEPTAALDIRHAAHVLAQARELADAGHAVVAVLHDLSVAAAHADRICVIADGHIRATGTPAEVLQPDLIADVYDHPVDVLTHDGRLVVVPRPVATHAPEEIPCVPAP